MINKKFLSSLLVSASLAGVVAFYACDKNDVTPADDGKKSAQELCDCFTKAGTDAAKVACISEFESKFQKYKNEDAKAFEDAFNEAIKTCGSSPYEWYSAYLGTLAANEMCDCFTGDFEAEMACMMGLMLKYGGYFRGENNPGDPIFEDAFDIAFYSCTKVPEWFICMWSPENCEVELTDEELAELGAQAAQELCECFTNAANAQAEQACMGAFGQYAVYMGNQVFQEAFGFGLYGCETVPEWFWEQFGGE